MSDDAGLCEFPATNGPCSNPATGEDGYCWLATHSDDPPEREPDGRGAPEGNQNAAKHHAWAESFVTDFLTDDEIARVKDAETLLGTPESAQDVAKTAAAIALEQFRRTGDDRFLRRFESICDKFGITPPDELEVSGQGGGALEVAISREIVDVND